MAKSLTIAVVLLSLVVVITVMSSVETKKSAKDCRDGREFWSCESPTKECQRLCENKDLKRESKSCDKTCLLSCVCLPGFLRHGEDGQCVPEAECA